MLTVLFYNSVACNGCRLTRFGKSPPRSIQSTHTHSTIDPPYHGDVVNNLQNSYLLSKVVTTAKQYCSHMFKMFVQQWIVS